MRFQINIDCSPEEARKFFGVPDVLPLQQALMEQLNAKLADNIKTMEPDALLQTWVPALFQGWSEIQQNFWSQVGKMGGVNINPQASEGDEPNSDDEPMRFSNKNKKR